MTDNSRKVFNFLKENHGVNVTAQEIAKELGITISAVTGSVNGLVKKSMAIRTEATVDAGEGKTNTVKYISLTDEGMAFDPDAEVEGGK